MGAGIQSALNPQGPEAAIIAEMAWVLIAGAALVFAIVMALAAYAVFARRENAQRLTERALVVGGGIVFPAVTLAALLLYTLLRASSLAVAGDGALRIQVVGEQWWWRVSYLDARGRVDFATANEIRIPVGRPVDLELRSADVLHSFWVPALGGKLDMIPGKTNRMRIAASRPGQFRGQCAEYCGDAHALMAFFMVAQPEDEFAGWVERQRAPANVPAAARGASLFQADCGACHTVRGTPAAGVRGPDLTHVGSRLTLGAGRVPLNAGTLAEWIAANQRLKPGNLMPQFAHYSAEELAAVAEYLGALR